MDTQPHRRRNTAHIRPQTAKQIALLRQCYQSFLLHFLLGLSISVLLLLGSIRLQTLLPYLPDMLRASIVSSATRTQTYEFSRTGLSQAVFSRAVYLPDDTAAMYFQVRSDEEITHSTTTPGAALNVPDRDAPLPPPSRLMEAVSDASDIAALPDGYTAIRTVDLSAAGSHTDANGGILFSNQTTYPITAARYLQAAYPIPAMHLPAVSDPLSDGVSAPLVLILHTHGTEAYAPDGAHSVSDAYTYRSEDTTENVVSVGEVLARTLTDAGIGVLHCRTMFDAESYPASYSRAAAYIRETVAAYPTIAYVFDVHRDALEDADGAMLRPVTEIGGEICAQVMSVVGTDDAGADHPDWHDNLTVAVHLQKRLNDAHPAFARPINLRSASFNAQYAPGSLLLEIGAAGNSAEEARSAAYHLGQILAEMILDP